ncbi:hypothetical protein QYE76_028050 [Lolium multiflorum]|uniref:TF-B3 domain-containing protein n=1 Tax=Lolium multiflorum TaxID=4521 RepID=A0AAD8QMY9_LOLMU|nr:hypothetical protein QYE76_028050 [Lolium multiflorum]
MALTAALPESTGAEQSQGVVKLARRNGGEERRREHMFDKVVTPSDVGKLNRLVVPKHFAERYFLPQLLGGGGNAASRLAGAVLRFEDGRGGGKAWAFRFSYWSSSQSYVMTKGWSAFVRDRRLAAGDTVSFYHAGARLFIDCRRRGARVALAPATPVLPAPSRVLVTSTPGPWSTPCSTSDDVGAPRGRFFRLFGVDLVLAGAEPPLSTDLQLALMR